MSTTPPPYDRQADFTTFQTPQAPTVGQGLEAEFNKLNQVLDATQARLAEIQRDDGKLANGSVHIDALDAGVQQHLIDESIAAGQAAIQLSVAAAAQSAGEAAASAAAAALSEAAAEAVAGPTYASVAAGEAATAVGVSFAVDNGDGTVSIYLRTSGGSTLQRSLATTASLAAGGGSDLFGAVGDGVTDDTAAINAAISYVNSLGGGVVRLMYGKTYLVSPLQDGIIMKSNVTLDLNGATIKKAKNGLPKYNIINISNVENVEVRNGFVVGDRDTHDFSSGGTHEFGNGINCNNAINVRIKSLEVSKCTGDGLYTGFARIAYYRNYTVSGGGIVAGGINASGVPDTGLAGYYTPAKMNISDVTGEWLHLWPLNFSRDYANGRAKAKIFYYTSSDVFISSETMPMFQMEKRISELPPGAAKIALHLSDWLWPMPSTAKIDLGSGAFGCTDVLIDDCTVFDCRRQGYSATGTKNIRMQRTRIYGIGGTAPGAAVDVEDGINTDITFKDCVFKDCNASFYNLSGIGVVLDGVVMDSPSAVNITLSAQTAETRMVNSTISNGIILTSGKTVVYGSDFRSCVFAGTPQSDGTAWSASASVALAVQRVPAAWNGFYYEVTTAGTTGLTEPSWPAVIGNTVTDGTVTWTCKGYSKAIPYLVSFSDCNFFKCSSNYNFTTTMKYVLSYLNCRMSYGVAGGMYGRYVNVDFDCYTSTAIPKNSEYSNCYFRAFPAANITFSTSSNFNGCTVSREGTTGGNYIAFHDYCSFNNGRIIDKCSVPSPLELKTGCVLANSRVEVLRNLTYFNEAIYANGANISIDGVNLDHTGTIASGSGIIGITTGSSGLRVRNSVFTTSDTNSRGLIYVRSGTATYDLFSNVLVKCVEPASSPGVNRLAGNSVV